MQVSNNSLFNSLLFLLFLGLKLTGHISWSWVWVCSPLWVPLVVGIAILGVIGFIAILCQSTSQKGLVRG